MMAKVQLSAGYPLAAAITYWQLCRELPDPSTTVRWCQRMRLLPSDKNCSCDRAMHLVKRKGSHLPIEKILRIIHLWSTQTQVGKTMEELEISGTAIKWYNFLRDVCVQYFIDHPASVATIGGAGVEVVIDESNRGRVVEDPETGAHTQQEANAMLSSCNERASLPSHEREERTINSTLALDTCLHELMWKRQFGGPLAFAKHISDNYPV